MRLLVIRVLLVREKITEVTEHMEMLKGATCPLKYVKLAGGPAFTFMWMS